MHRILLLAVLALASLPAVTAAAEQTPKFALRPGDHVAIVGNTLADRMQHDGWLEAVLQARHPEHRLVFRNLGFSADELTTRLRSAGFGSPDEWLARVEADVVLAFFGYNESFGDEAELEQFKADLRNFVRHTTGQKYNGQSPPRLVLFSPIAHENLNDPDLPDGTENNRRLKLYTAAMAEVAHETGTPFVDLFNATQQLYGQMDKPLTINGIHLNSLGNRYLALAIGDALFPKTPLKEIDEDSYQRLRAAVQDKNFHWFNRYRTTDGYSIYGGRSHLKFVDGQTNREVMQREMEVLDAMTANRDKVVWAAANGGLLKPDDSNTPPFIPVETNKPGPLPDGGHLFLGGEEAITKMTVADGLAVNLFASEEQFPELASPVQMAFDTRGRLWVAAWPTYPHWQPKVEEMDDKLLILEDTDGDGRADKCKTFAGGLHNPTGFEFWGGGVLVAMAPDILFLKDTDGDDVADVRTRVLSGIDSADTHHTANSFTLDPGGALYFQEGTFHHTQVETPHGAPVRSVNAGVFRYEPKTHKFGVHVAYGFANPHGHVFDRWGQGIVHDGTGAQPYHGTLFSGHLDYPQKHRQPPQVYQQRTRPCPATELLSSRHFPEAMQGDLLVGNVIGFQGILRYEVKEKGASFTADEEEPLLFSSDPNFRPVDLEVAPDGSLYFVDWQNPIIGHMQHNLRDPSRDKVHGRVYRITAKGRDLLDSPKIAGEPTDKLLDLLGSPEDRVRYRTKIELSGRDTEEVIAAVRTWAAALDPQSAADQHRLMEALWVHQYHNVVDEPLLRTMLRSPDYHARAAATRVLCDWRDRVSDPLALLKVQAEDESPLVRLEAVRAASFFRNARAADVALAALKKPADEYIRYTLGETMRQLEPFWKQAVNEGEAIAADNPAGVDYLLASVSTPELVKLPRTAMVYQALLSRDGVLHEQRHEALVGLAKLNKTDLVTELLAAMDRLDKSDLPSAGNVLAELSHILTSQPSETFARYRQRIEELAESARRPITRRVAFVTLITADGSIDPVWNKASRSVATLRDLVSSVPLIPDAKLRASAHPKVAPLLHALPTELAEKVGSTRGTVGRFVRIELPGPRRTLTLAEVEVFSDGRNIAPQGSARQSVTAHGGVAGRAIDGNTDGDWASGTQTHTPEGRPDPWWELDLGAEVPVEAIAVWNRSKNGGELAARLEGFTLTVLDSARQAVFEKTGIAAPAPSVRVEMDGDPTGAVRRAAIDAITYTGVNEEDTFRTLAGFILNNELRAAAVKALSRVPRSGWPEGQVRPVIEDVIARVKETPAKDRTAPAILDELSLANRLSVALPKEEAERTRRTLREIGVHVIRLRPVPHKMIYDRGDVYAEAGKPVEVIFENVDIMPHNLVVTRPGALVKVALAGEAMAQRPDAFAKGFVPDMPEVLHATRLLQPSQTDRLSFTAPSEPGDYPFVCTFPGHWRRMYGTLHVVSNLDDVPPEALAPPENVDVPARPFVRAWKPVDLADQLTSAAHGRSFEQGHKLFTEMSCVRCHRMNGQGGQVGPDLADVKKKLIDGKMSRAAILQEILEPSAKIEEKYKPLTVLDTDGRTHTGLVAERTKDYVVLLTNPLDDKSAATAGHDHGHAAHDHGGHDHAAHAEPASEQPQGTKILVTDIEQQIVSKVSLMPEGLVNTLTREELLDLLFYVESAADPNHTAFTGGE
jgi:putative heme-binding domain-containing protein